jgi:putative tryptophan/tyrosine transport system substrate-binding protein
VRRRLFLGGLATGFIGRGSKSQVGRKLPRVGVMLWRAEDEPDLALTLLRRGLHELGYVERRDIIIEPRWADSNRERAGAQAKELAELGVAAIVAEGTLLAQAAQGATRTIPIVAATVDAVGLGFAESLARPGGNVTGLSLNQFELSVKRMELVREMLPGLSRVAYLAAIGDPVAHLYLQHTESAGRRLGVAVLPFQAHRDGGIEGIAAVFAAMAEARADAVFVSPLLTPMLDTLVDLAQRYRLPMASEFPVFAQDGGLFAIGADMREVYGKFAGYVDRILKGARAADLPIEQPTKFELVINLKTARELGIDVPPAILARADEVIE